MPRVHSLDIPSIFQEHPLIKTRHIYYYEANMCARVPGITQSKCSKYHRKQTQSPVQGRVLGAPSLPWISTIVGPAVTVSSDTVLLHPVNKTYV